MCYAPTTLEGVRLDSYCRHYCDAYARSGSSASLTFLVTAPSDTAPSAGAAAAGPTRTMDHGLGLLSFEVRCYLRDVLLFTEVPAVAMQLASIASNPFGCDKYNACRQSIGRRSSVPAGRERCRCRCPCSLRSSWSGTQENLLSSGFTALSAL